MQDDSPQQCTSPANSSTDCPALFMADFDTAPPRLLRPTPLIRQNCPSSPGKPGKSLTQSCQVACPLCCSKRANFYCAECVTNGDYVHSSTRLFERFSEKNLRLFSLRRDNDECKAMIEEAARRNWEVRRLKEEIKAARTNVKYYKHIISKTLDKRTVNLQLLNKLKASNQRRVARLPKFEDKAVRMAACADNFLQDMRRTREELLVSRQQLRSMQAAFVQSLHYDIFPVSEVLPCSSPTPAPPDLVLDCLADAMRTSYVHGRWVTGDRSGEVQYRIVSPLLSGSGDYTPVYAWVATNKPSGGGSSDTDLALPAHTIAAGLALASQLTALTAAHIGLLLPAKISFQDFGVLETSEYRFARKVAKLNMNVVTVCLHLGLGEAGVRPCHTLRNLYRAMQRTSWGGEEGGLRGQDRAEMMVNWEGLIQREAEELRLAQEESDDSETEAEAEGEWVECDTVAQDTQEVARRLEEEQEERRRTLDRQSSIVSSVSSLLWGLAQSPKSPKK